MATSSGRINESTPGSDTFPPYNPLNKTDARGADLETPRSENWNGTEERLFPRRTETGGRNKMLQSAKNAAEGSTEYFTGLIKKYPLPAASVGFGLGCFIGAFATRFFRK
jgi:hypothetical protein